MKKQPISILSRGRRSSTIRATLLDIFSSVLKPLSVAELLNLLGKKGKLVNKTTVYREIQFLLSQGIITAVLLDETHTKYELQTTHHHHLVCKGCGSIEEVEMKEIEAMFPIIEKKFKQKKKFTSIIHTLEFFGFCQKCS